MTTALAAHELRRGFYHVRRRSLGSTVSPQPEHKRRAKGLRERVAQEFRAGHCQPSGKQRRSRSENAVGVQILSADSPLGESSNSFPVSERGRRGPDNFRFF